MKTIVPSLFSDVATTLGTLCDDVIHTNIRLGVTGLSHAGKTTFITSLVYCLKKQGLLQAILTESDAEALPLFSYHDHLERLRNGQWPESTSDESRIRLKLRLASKGRLTHRSSAKDVYLDIIDYPGEWLLDLGLVGLSYEKWSAEMAAYIHKTEPRSPEWAVQAEALSLDAARCLGEDAAQATYSIADLFCSWLDDRRACGFSFIQPGRFLRMPGDHSCAFTTRNFVPWIWESPEVTRLPGAKALHDRMRKNFNIYRDTLARPFHRQFKRLNKQIVLIDVLNALQHGDSAWEDLLHTLGYMLKYFSYGNPDGMLRWLQKKMSNPWRIESVLFAMTKSDHFSTGKATDRLLDMLIRDIAEQAINQAGKGGDIDYDAALMRNIASVATLRPFSEVTAETAQSDDERSYIERNGPISIYWPNGRSDARHVMPSSMSERNRAELSRFCMEHPTTELQPARLGYDSHLPNRHMDNVIDWLLDDIVKQ